MLIAKSAYWLVLALIGRFFLKRWRGQLHVMLRRAAVVGILNQMHGMSSSCCSHQECFDMSEVAQEDCPNCRVYVSTPFYKGCYLNAATQVSVTFVQLLLWHKAF